MDASIIWNYFPGLSDHQKHQFLQLHDLYKYWNDRINVISRKDIHELYLRHVLHSLAIARFVTFIPRQKILDIGTGGGFPGIPLSIMFPDTQFHLVDSVGKKIRVASEIVKALSIRNIQLSHKRAEELTEQFDFIVTRAVARARVIWNWSHQKISQRNIGDIDNGIICLKGGDLTEELRELNRPYIELQIGDYFNEPFFETKKIIYIPR